MASLINNLTAFRASPKICLSCRNLCAAPLILLKNCPCCEVIEQARRLFAECVSLHPECKMPTWPPLPSRVLDVGEAEDPRFPFLYIPEEGSQQQGSYVALSYCWGNNPRAFAVTTNSNIHGRRAGIPLSSLPSTLREAVYITRRLHIRYLWIDALCIIQGSEEDWTRNAARMDEIYGNATVTISAASAASCTERVLSPRLYQHWKLPSELSPDYEPINHRAWTLQERLLSRRYISFSTEYMTWQCRNPTEVRWSSSIEATSVSGKFALRSYHLSGYLKNRYNFWKGVVTDYTARSLTNENDKLPAISGVVKTLHSCTGDQYFAGLWKHEILQQLRWKADRSILKSIPHKKAREYRAPSWSWASVDGNISFTSAGQAGSGSATDFIDCTVEPLSIEDPFGRVRSGTLVLRGPLKQASEVRWEAPRYGMAHLFGGDGTLKIGPVWPDIGPEYPQTEIREEWEKWKPWCLQLSAKGSGVALLLVEEHERNTYQRVGLVYLANMDWFEDARIQTVSII